MKLFYYIFFIINIYKVELCFIQNQYKPLCSNCKFFVPYENKCKKFGEVNIVTGKYTYENANDVRSDEDKCGDYAIFYKNA
jgi:hypothetical protein